MSRHNEHGRRKFPAVGMMPPRTERERANYEPHYYDVPPVPTAPTPRQTLSDVDARQAQAREYSQRRTLRYEPHADGTPGGRVEPIVQPQRAAVPQAQPAKSDAWRATLDEKFGRPAVDAELHRLGEFAGKPVDERNRDVICTHESCHAIVADAIGMPVRKIVATLDRSGYVSPELSALKVNGGDWRESLLRYGSYMLAGIVGEEIKFGSRQTFDSSEDGDEKQLAKLVNVFFADKEGRAAFYAEVRAFARKVLTERWSDVERVAAALRKRGSMSGDEFRQIVPAVQVRRVQLPLQTRSGSASFDAEAGTIECIWGTGQRVLRSGWDGKFWEDLPAANADLSFLNSGRAPFLNTHSSTDTADVYGVVVENSAHVRDGKGFATIRLGSNAPRDDLRSGVLASLSIGYTISKMTRLPAGDDDIPIMRVDAYRIKEISLCPLGADEGAMVRKFECEWIGG